jgi:anti-sigma factor RsiW
VVQVHANAYRRASGQRCIRVNVRTARRLVANPGYPANSEVTPMTHIDGRAGGGSQMGDPFAMWDAAYVLGALAAEDRRQFEQHLTNCTRCHEAVAELSGMPALLASLDPHEVAALDDGAPELSQPRPELLTSLLEKVKWRRRRTRALSWSMAGAAAAAAIIALIVGIHVGGSAPSPAPPATLASPLTMSPVAANSISATVSLTRQRPPTSAVTRWPW